MLNFGGSCSPLLKPIVESESINKHVRPLMWEKQRKHISLHYI